MLRSMPKLYLVLLSILLAIAANAQNEGSTIKGEEVSYSVNGTKLKGYLAYDTAVRSPRPGIIIVHEWWGHNDYVRQRADQLAAMGYVAFALDMYGDGKQAAHPQDANAFMMDAFNDMDRSEARFIAAKNVLEKHSATDATKLAAIGYCFGGGIVLQMARNGVDLRGVASFHGNLATHPTAAQAGKVKAKLLVLHGADDPLIPPEQVEAFKREMDTANVDYKFIAYPGAVHAFTNKEATQLGKQFNLPIAYNPQADQQSWQELETFLQNVFGE